MELCFESQDYWSPICADLQINFSRGSHTLQQKLKLMDQTFILK